MFDLLETIRSTVEPLARGERVADWQARAARLSALGDYYAVRLRDTPFFQQEDAGPGGAAGSRAPLRAVLRERFAEAMAADRISYDFEYGPLPGPERAVFGQLFHQVDSVERLAMSGLAHAFCHLAPPLSAAVAMCGLFADEAHHLESLSRLLDLRSEAEPWITPKREPFWRLMREAEDLLAFVFVQHCLSEVEGSLSAAQKARQLAQAGVGGPAARVAHRIFSEETNHALTGYALLKQLDDSRPAADFQRLIARYLEVEPLVDPQIPKGRRQRFSLRVAELYVERRNLEQVRAEILGAAQAALAGAWP